MYDVNWFRHKKITVMGLGLHGGGVGIAKWLMRHGAAVTVTDLKGADELKSSVAELNRVYDREVAKRGEDAATRFVFSLGSHAEKDFAAADLVIRNPAVPRENPFLSLAASRGVPVETDISLFCLLCPFPITAVTGTKGKTTTTTLLAEICRAHDSRTVVGGNIRISPLDSLDRLLELKKKGQAGPPVVLELSSWQLESLERHALSPHVGVITNVMEDHLNRYRDIEDYASAKELNVRFQGAGDVAILNAEDVRVAVMGRRLIERSATESGGRGMSGDSLPRPQSRARGARRGTAPAVLWFAMKRVPNEDGCFVSGGQIVTVEGGEAEPLLPLAALKIKGEHNVGNVLAACAAARAIGIPPRVIAKVVRQFRGVPGRLEDLGVKGGVRYVNDTTATTPDASMAAMRAWERTGRKLILLSGGADKALRFEDWAAAVKRHVKFLSLFEGTATPKMLAALQVVGWSGPTTIVKSMKEAFRASRETAKRGDIILLSPGCASFGVFTNEFDRGDQFVAAVKRLV